MRPPRHLHYDTTVNTDGCMSKRAVLLLMNTDGCTSKRSGSCAAPGDAGMLQDLIHPGTLQDARHPCQLHPETWHNSPDRCTTKGLEVLRLATLQGAAIISQAAFVHGLI
eukprot:scaffold16438_cov25-Tisochrysis_lutea.AAC.2